MHPEEFREMQALEENHWWFQGKRLLLETMLDRLGAPAGGRLLDVGCGTGGVLRALAGGRTVVGVDRADLPLRYCREKGLREVAQGSALALPFRAQSFDVCVLMDVLEHVDDERVLLAEVRRVLRPGGMAVVSVPAFQALWSPHDVVLEHRRRYRRGELVRRLDEAGLRVAWSSYTNFFVFPPALVWRTLRRWTGIAAERRSDFFPVPPFVNRALVGSYRCEAALLRRLRLPFGVSVACLARAPERA